MGEQMGDGTKKNCNCSDAQPSSTPTKEELKADFDAKTSLRKIIKELRSGFVQFMIMMNGFLLKYKFEYRKPSRKMINEVLKISGDLLTNGLEILPIVIGDIMNSPYWPGVINKCTIAYKSVGNAIETNLNTRRIGKQIYFAAKYAAKSATKLQETELTDEMIINDAMASEMNGTMPSGYAQFVKEDLLMEAKEKEEEAKRQKIEDEKAEAERVRIRNEEKQAKEESEKLEALGAWNSMVSLHYGPNSGDYLQFTEEDKEIFLSKYHFSHAGAELDVTKRARARMKENN